VVSRLREGLPKEADDSNMEEPIKAAELLQAEFVVPSRPPQPSASCSAVGAEASEDGCAASDEGPAGKGDGTGIEDEETQDMPWEPQKVVAALQEMDDSDAEPECKSGSTYDEFGVRYPNKPLRLWRTARDRAAWLADVRRAELVGSVSGAAYCAATLLDRSQPLTIRLANFARLAATPAGGAELESEAALETLQTEGTCAGTPQASLGLRSSKRLRDSGASASDTTPNHMSTAAPAKVCHDHRLGCSQLLPGSVLVLAWYCRQFCAPERKRQTMLQPFCCRYQCFNTCTWILTCGVHVQRTIKFRKLSNGASAIAGVSNASEISMGHYSGSAGVAAGQHPAVQKSDTADNGESSEATLDGS
jgi:hypothetical protein